MNYKIIGWIIASFNSTFNGNSMVHGNQMVPPNNNAYPVASSSTWHNTADPFALIGQKGWTEDERMEGEKYASFVKEYIDPHAVITPEEVMHGRWLQQKHQAPIELSAFTRWEDHQPNRQIETEPHFDCAFIDRIKEDSSHQPIWIAAPASGVRFYFKFDPALSSEEIKDMMRSFEEAINNYEQQIGLPSSSLLHKVYVHKWNEVKNRSHGMHQFCSQDADKTTHHLMTIFLGGLEHTAKHEMGHVLHNVHTKMNGIPLLIGDGIAQHCSLSDEQKRAFAKETLELFQSNGSFSTINSIKKLCEQYEGDDRYKVGPTLIQYIQYYYKGRLQAYLGCIGNVEKCSSNCYLAYRYNTNKCVGPACRKFIETEWQQKMACVGQCNACINGFNIDMEGFKKWLEWKVSVDQAKSYVPPILTGEPVTGTTHHTVSRNGRQWQPTVPRWQPTMPRDDRRPQPHGCASVAYLDLACDAEKCSVIRESARQYHGYTHHHTDDCTNVIIHNQITPHTREAYRCMGEWSKWIHKAIKIGSGMLPASYTKEGISNGCNLIASSAVTATGATPTDGANSDGSYSIYWVPATIVGGVASSAAICMGVKKFYNRYCW